MKRLTLVTRKEKNNPGSPYHYFLKFVYCFKMMVHPSTVYSGMVCHGMVLDVFRSY